MQKESVYGKMTKPEKEVAELLKEMGIKWSYEQPVFVWDENKRPRVWAPDFYLIPFGIYVEVCGSERFDYEYRRRIFDNNGYRVIFLHLYKERDKWKNHFMDYLEKITDYRYHKLNEIWIMNSDGSNKHMIYAPEDSYQWPFQRAWNKNNEILFMKNGILEDKLPKMFIINSDGTNPRHMFSLPYDSLDMPELFYIDPVWDNTYTKVVSVKKVIDGTQNIVTFSGEE